MVSLDFPAQVVTLSRLLQWSHVFSDMVRMNVHYSSKNMEWASMEPCLFRHGKVLVATWNEETKLASMEPCLFRHGKNLHLKLVYILAYASMEPCLFRHGKVGLPNPGHGGAM